MKKTKIKKNDQVLVIAGKDRGAKGKVLRVLPAQELRDRRAGEHGEAPHRPNPQKGIQGGVLEREAPIRLSNLMVIDPNRREADADRTPAPGGRDRSARRQEERRDSELGAE